MTKNTNKTKKTRTNFDLTWDSYIHKYYTILLKLKICYFSTYCQILLKQRSLNHFRPFWLDIIWQCIFFYQNILKSFNDFQNQNFSILWLEWTYTMKMKQNQTYLHGTYPNLTPVFIKTYENISRTCKIEISQFPD